MRANIIISGLCAVWLGGAALGGAAVGDPRAEVHGKKVSLDISAQPMGDALNEFAHQAGLQVVFYTEIGKGLSSPRVSGSYTAREALEKLLANTGLHWQFINEETVAIHGEKEGSSSGLGKTIGAAAVNEGGGIRLAQAGVTTDSGALEGEQQDEKVELEEIVVTGSRMMRRTIAGAQDVRVYSSEVIQRSGQTNVAAFLNTLPSVSTSVTENQFQQRYGATSVQLRGLPEGTTLILLNGRRIQTSGTQGLNNFFDLNNIPLAAVERVEVLASGASAIYGSDAIAGVVNIILKTNTDGISINAKYGRAKGIDESNTGVTWGQTWSRGSLSLVGSYQKRSELTGAERELTASNDYTRFGGPDNNLSACNPGNVFFPGGFSFNGGSPVDYAAVPQGLAGNATIQDFAATAGQLNTCPLASRSLSIIPPTERSGALLGGSYELTPTVSLFAEVLYSHLRQDVGVLPQQLFGIPGFQSFTVAPANPYNPFGETVGIGYAFSDSNLRLGQDLSTDFFRPLVGAKGHFGAGWSWEVSAFQSRDSSQSTEVKVIADAVAIQAALDSADPATALNPFTTGAPGSPALVNSFFSDGAFKFIGLSRTVGGFLRGAAGHLPAGPIQVVVGSEYSYDRLYSNAVNYPGFEPNTRSTYGRHTSAVFAEARVPVLTKTSEELPDEVLMLTLAGRYDRYSDFGNSSNPQFGLEWRPLESLLLRATYADSFKAPSLYALNTPVSTAPENVVNDPQTNQTVIVPLTTGGNPSLEPEIGRSSTAGVLYSSQAIPDLQLSLTHWQVKQLHTVKNLDLQFIVDNEASFPDRVTRDAGGNITLIDATALNFGSIDVAGLDYQVSYQKTTRLGIWSPTLSASQTHRYRTALIPGAPSLDRVSTADTSGWAPRWKGTAALGWKWGPYAASIDGRYVGSYQDYDSPREIGDFWLCDVNVHYEFGHAFAERNRFVNQAYLALGAVNLFDKKPQYSNYFASLVGYDPTQTDIRGRFPYIQLALQW